jgi:hypothetical protein
MARSCRNLLRFCSPRERLERDQGPPGLQCPAQNRWDIQKASWFSPKTNATRLAKLYLLLHDGEEIGPAALARIGKDTGLRPEDI